MELQTHPLPRSTRLKPAPQRTTSGLKGPRHTHTLQPETSFGALRAISGLSFDWVFSTQFYQANAQGAVEDPSMQAHTHTHGAWATGAVER